MTRWSSRLPIGRSFIRFLGLKISDRVPDSKTIWKFRETLIQKEVIEVLFYRFNQALDDQSVFAKNGQIVDASFVEVPCQRNTREENKQIKKEHTHEAWKKNPNKLCWKDRNACQTKKNKMNFYGNENSHIKVDHGTKLINAYAVSDVAHDSSRRVSGKYLSTKTMLFRCSMLTVLHRPRGKRQLV